MPQFKTLINQAIINAESLKGLPGPVFWKDTNFAYQSCNEVMMEVANFQSDTDVIGTRDEDNYWHEYAAEYRADDEQVLLTKKGVMNTVSILSSEGEVFEAFSLKAPLIYDDQIKGILGISILSATFEFDKILKSMQKISSCLSEVFCFNQSHTQLSKREIECVRLLLGGYRIKEIGAYLEISPRTIESHIESSKYKLKCTTSSELRNNFLRRGIAPIYINE